MQPGMLAGAIAKNPAITVNTNWGTTTGATGTLTSATRTIAAPAGSNLQLDLGTVDGPVTAQYQKNGGTWTTFTDLTVLAIAQADTLAFRCTGASTVGDGYTLVVKNNANGVTVGTAQFTRT